MIRMISLLLLVLLAQGSHAQSFVNGNFENNTAGGIDRINLSNTELNAMLPGVTSFGSYGDVDIIYSASYGGGGAQDKTWYVAITGGGTDIIAMQLTAPLQAGKTYGISFYDRKDRGYPANPICIGLSDNNTNFGTPIYSTEESPVDNLWTQRTFTFTAPNNGQYITVKMATGDISSWANIDNFTFTKTKCPTRLAVLASAKQIEKGSTVTFTASGGGLYNWTAPDVATSTLDPVIHFSPEKSTTYTVSSKEDGCPTLTASVAVEVIEAKKDTVIAEVPHDKPDTTTVKPRYVKFNKHSLNGRKYKVQETVTVNVPLVKLLVWDKNRVDGDIVSVYLNGQLLEENLEVSKSKKEIMLPLQSGSNILVLYSVNVGRIPPNTAAIRINDGSKHRISTIVSDFKKSGAVEIIYNADAVTLK